MTYDFTYNKPFDYFAYGFTPNYYANNSYNSYGLNSFDNIFSFKYRNLIRNPQQTFNFNYSSPSIMTPNLSMLNLTTPSLMMPNLSMPSLITPSLMMPSLQLPPLQLSFQAPALNFNSPNPFANNTQTQSTTPVQTSKTSGAKSVSTDGPSNTHLKTKGGKYDLAFWKSQGYDEKLGQRLAKDAVARCPYKWNGNCVGYTRQTINKIFGQNYGKAGNVGYKFGHNYLTRPEIKKYWKCFKINGIRPEEIPDGAVLIWPGSAFKSEQARKYGHGAIAYKGKPYSDNVGCNTMKCTEIWIPVKA